MYAYLITNIKQAVTYLTEGRVVAFPTGTTYGFAVDALQGHALQRLRNLKQRPSSKTFTVFMSTGLYAKYLDLSSVDHLILKSFDNQPLTLLVKVKPALSHLSRDGLIGLRVIDHPLMRQLADAMPTPLSATSANISNQSPCFSPDCILKSFPGLLPVDRLGETDPAGAANSTYDLSLAAILDAGSLPPQPPTTIIKIVNNQAVIIREGKITAPQINQALSD